MSFREAAFQVTSLAVLLALFFPKSLPGLPNKLIQNLSNEATDALLQPSLPLQGNTALRAARVLFPGQVKGSESVMAEDGGASLLMLDKYNNLWRASSTDMQEYQLGSSPLAHLGIGRPLGFHKDGQGNLIVCNSNQGLLQLEAGDRGRVVLLSARVSDSSPLDPGSPITYANDLDIDRDGTIYFTDSQDIPVQKNWIHPEPWFDTFTSYLCGLYSGAQTGRLLAYHPHNRTTHVLAKGIWYANGVALASDSSFVAVAETNQFRVLRYWLKGPKAGSVDVLVDRLPGFPDGVSRAPDGNFWVAMPGRKTGMVAFLRFKIVRSLLPWLPENLRPKVPAWGGVLKVDDKGQVISFLEDPTGENVAYVSAVEELEVKGRGKRLYIGNIVQDYVSYIDLQEG